tara:strand:+ start:689 stop:886 length:198 start_codon:yes stop_codon:yes gene_type:complete
LASGRTSIVYHNINFAHLFYRPLHHLIYLIGIGHIRFFHKHLSPHRFDLFGNSGQTSSIVARIVS